MPDDPDSFFTSQMDGEGGLRFGEHVNVESGCILAHCIGSESKVIGPKFIALSRLCLVQTL